MRLSQLADGSLIQVLLPILEDQLFIPMEMVTPSPQSEVLFVETI